MEWTFKQFITSYLVERDVQKALSLVTDDIYAVDMYRGKTISSKVDLKNFFIAEMKQEAYPFAVRFEDFMVRHLGADCGQIFASLTICRKEVNERDFRVKIHQTATMCLQDDGHYKICSLHTSQDFFEEEKTRQALRISEQRFQIALSLTSHIVFEYHLDTEEVYHFNQSMEMYGIKQTLHDVPQSLIDNGVIHPVSVEDFRLMYEKIRAGEETASCVIQTRLKDGVYIWNRITLLNIFDQAGTPVRAVGIIEDITKQREVEIKYAQEEQYRMVLFSNAMMTYEMNISQDCLLKGHNQWYDWMQGLETDHYQALIEKIAHRAIHPDDREIFLQMHSRERLLAAYAKGVYECKDEYRIIDQAGRSVWVCCTIHLLQDVLSKEIKGFAYVRNIDDRKNKEISLQYRAEHDLLTDLYNKQTTEILIKEYLQQAHFQSIHAFMLIDLDDFKAVNDNLGHGFGDAVLVEVAQKIQSIFRKSDIIGRIGGDEYVLFLKGIHSQQQALFKAEELCQAFRYFFVGEKKQYKISGTVGIAFFPRDGVTFAELYQKADMALYRAKKLGKNGYAVYGHEEEDGE